MSTELTTQAGLFSLIGTALTLGMAVLNNPLVKCGFSFCSVFEHVSVKSKRKRQRKICYHQNPATIALKPRTGGATLNIKSFCATRSLKRLIFGSSSGILTTVGGRVDSCGFWHKTIMIKTIDDVKHYARPNKTSGGQCNSVNSCVHIKPEH